MTDNEIIKALECFAIDKDFDCSQCVGCAFETKGMCYENASEGIAKATLDLINRQKAEIERANCHIDKLLHVTDDLVYECDCAKQEAIKEFAERLLNNYATYRLTDEISVDAVASDIKHLVKEMTGEAK